MDVYRGFVVWGAGIVIVLGVFLIFVAVGWPGGPDDCIYDTPDTCFCEAFVAAEVEAGAPGVRQPVNTWFNLYAILLLARGRRPGLICSPYPDRQKEMNRNAA